MSEEKPKVDINVVQVMASALAAVSSAVLLSTVGVAGTIIGAAAGSVIATVGAALYSYSLRVSRERVQAAQAAAVARMSRLGTGLQTRRLDLNQDAEGASAEGSAADRPDEPDEPDESSERHETPAWREALKRLSWKWVAGVATAVFVIAMVVIVGFEAFTGRSVSSMTGGSDGNGHRTSLGFGSSSSATKSPTPSPSASSGSTPSGSRSSSAPSSTPTTQAPSASSSPSAEPSDPEATTTPTATATDGATPSDDATQ